MKAVFRLCDDYVTRSAALGLARLGLARLGLARTATGWPPRSCGNGSGRSSPGTGPASRSVSSAPRSG